MKRIPLVLAFMLCLAAWSATAQEQSSSGSAVSFRVLPWLSPGSRPDEDGCWKLKEFGLSMKLSGLEGRFFPDEIILRPVYAGSVDLPVGKGRMSEVETLTLPSSALSGLLYLRKELTPTISLSTELSGLRTTDRSASEADHLSMKNGVMYDSTDNPFFPTKGMRWDAALRSSVSDERIHASLESSLSFHLTFRTWTAIAFGIDGGTSLSGPLPPVFALSYTAPGISARLCDRRVSSRISVRQIFDALLTIDSFSLFPGIGLTGYDGVWGIESGEGLVWNTDNFALEASLYLAFTMNNELITCLTTSLIVSGEPPTGFPAFCIDLRFSSEYGYDWYEGKN